MENIVIKVLVVLGIIGCIYGAVFFIIKEQQEWEKFSNEHQCKIISKTQAQTHVGYGMNFKGNMSMMVITEDEKTAWLCNDGITYWR